MFRNVSVCTLKSILSIDAESSLFHFDYRIWFPHGIQDGINQCMSDMWLPPWDMVQFHFLVGVHSCKYLFCTFFCFHPPHKQEIITSHFEVSGIASISSSRTLSSKFGHAKAKGKQKVWRHEAQKLRAHLLLFAFCWYSPPEKETRST